LIVVSNLASNRTEDVLVDRELRAPTQQPIEGHAVLLRHVAVPGPPALQAPGDTPPQTLSARADLLGRV
jgi:hypothetical protein